MLVKVKPKKMTVYLSNGKMTCAQVREKTGCDICLNGTFYDRKNMKPVCDVKVDGVVLADSQSVFFGYGWNENDERATMSNQMYKWDNYISCVALLKDGRVADIQYNSDVGGKRGRSAIGYTNDGTMVIYCYGDGSSGACTPEQLATKMLSYGCVDALCLDGGGSVQIDCDEGKVVSSRKVANFICIWEDDNIKTYSKAKNGSKKLSANFAVREFAVTGNDTVRVDMRLVDTLQKIRTRFGKAVNIRRTSAQVPSAASIYISGINPIDIARYAESIGVGEIGLEKTTVHIGITDRKVRWDKTSGVKKTVETFMQDNAAVVKERFGFDDNTMKYLKDYRFADALLEKLATAK